MDKELNLQEKLEIISNSEGAGFAYDIVGIEKEYLKSNVDKSSLPIKMLSIVGGFMSTMAFLGFLLIAGLYESEIGMVIFGFLFISVAILLNKKIDKLIVDTLSISAYLIGLCLMTFGLAQLEVDENVLSLLLIVISLCSPLIAPNYILSFSSVLIINGNILFLIVNNHFYNLIHIYISIIATGLSLFFLNEAKLITAGKLFSKLYNPVRIGLVFSLISSLIFVGKRGLLDDGIYYIWASSIITIPVTIYIISIVLTLLHVTDNKTKILIYVCTFLVLLPTALSPAISGALLIILLSFLVNFKAGSAIGIISFVYFISQYYYDLNFTLLTKSIVLFLSGILFLLFFVFTHKKLGANEKI